MLNINALIIEISNSLIRAITGNLFADEQIKTITSNAIGRYFSEWLPQPEEELQAQIRVEKAKEHISKASRIINEMQKELEDQTHQLDEILHQIEEKKQLAERYEVLTKTSKKKLEAFRKEMEETLRNELIAQAEKGKRLRQVASILIWLFTLILGAALGAYFKDILEWGKSLIG